LTTTKIIDNCLIMILTFRHHLTVPRYRFNTFGRRTFSGVGPTSWNSLSDHLCDTTFSCDSSMGN